MERRYLPLLTLGLLLAGCSRNVQNEAAVRQGVIDYLSARTDLNLSQMQVDVTSVSFRQNEADAVVAFRPKGGADSAGMQMRYTLERKGDRWVVKKSAGAHTQRQPAGGTGGQMQMPPGHPPMGAAPPASGTKP